MKAALPELHTAQQELLERQKVGNRLGSHFYNTLTHKRVKGKFKVRGTSKITDKVDPNRNFSPERWQEIKAEEKKKKTYENANKKVA
jgi:hypothetical protein